MEKEETQSLDYDNFHYQFVKPKAQSVDFLNILITYPILWPRIILHVSTLDLDRSNLVNKKDSGNVRWKVRPS